MKKKEKMDSVVGHKYIGGKRRVIRRTRTGHKYYNYHGRKIICG